jgi:hypothetical protein
MGVDQDSGVRVLEDPLTNKGHRLLRGRTLRAGLAWPAAGGSGDAGAAGAPQVPDLPGAANVASAVAKAAVADAVAPALTDDQIDQAMRRATWRRRYKT